MKRFILTPLLFYASVLLSSYDLPSGWFKAGSKPQSYEMGIDQGAGPDGKNAATIKSIEKKINGFGTLMQNSSPVKYLGKRIRMSGYLKSDNVKEKAGLWLRIDKEGSRKPLAFDNMHDRPVIGTTGWKKYEIVLDVPVDASNMAYGALLIGTGQIWFDQLNFEIVDNTIPVTKDSYSEPVNLDFEK